MELLFIVARSNQGDRRSINIGAAP
jgi:hypothetical protein